jgi:hypothetical protein
MTKALLTTNSIYTDFLTLNQYVQHNVLQMYTYNTHTCGGPHDLSTLNDNGTASDPTSTVLSAHGWP